MKTGRIGLTQGYLFSDYPANPERLNIFNGLLAKPVTNEVLQKQLAAYLQTSKPGRPKPYQPFRGIAVSIKAAAVTVGDTAAPVTKAQLTKLLDELKVLTARVETRLRAL